MSQTLVGIAQGRHTVDVKRDWDLVFSVENERTVTLQKKTPSGQALPGMQFDFYFVAGRDEYLAGENELHDTEIKKDVIRLENDLSSEYAYGEEHCWIISVPIPRDIENGQSFVISDVLDNRLDFCGHVQVTVESKDGTIVAATLAEGEDYVLSVRTTILLGRGNPPTRLPSA